MKIAIIGVGAMGSYFASKLVKGNEVVGLDRNLEKINLINKDGMNIIENMSINNYKFKCYLAGEYKIKQDLVIVFVKSIHTYRALEGCKDIIDKNTLVLSLQNGLGNVDDILKFVNKDNIILGNTRINCVNKGNNIVECSGNGMTNVASYVNNDEHSKKIYNMFLDSNFQCQIKENVRVMIWHKLAINAAVSPLSAIFKCTIFDICDNKFIWRMAKEIIKETCDVAKLINIDLNVDEIIEAVKDGSIKFKNGYASMYQDVTLKKETEIDRINGAILKIAERNNYDARYTAFVVESIKAIEKQY